MFKIFPFFRQPVARAEISDRRWAIATLSRDEKVIRDGCVARIDRTSFAPMR